MKPQADPSFGSIAFASATSFLMLGCILFSSVAIALQPPPPELVEQYKRDGTFAERAAFSAKLENHIMRPDLARRASLRLKQLANPDSATPKSPPPAWQGMPTKGTNRFPVFLIDFPDQPHVNAVSNIQSALFEDGNPARYPKESLRNYYRRASYNQLELEGNLLDWHTMQHEREWYPTNGGTAAVIAELIQHFDPIHDFAQYDRDGNGKVDYFAILWSGQHTGWGSFWWAYYSGLPTPIVADGVEFNRFSWQWESNPVGA
ncbi:MAG TPA: hypothetical protein VK846_06280, partial [Candidatus Limnocylindria bacterium]|nr:hypothetical protein [Candidatus Limnocylindria bacterium]